MRYSRCGQKEHSVLKEANARQASDKFVPLVVDVLAESTLSLTCVCGSRTGWSCRRARKTSTNFSVLSRNYKDKAMETMSSEYFLSVDTRRTYGKEYHDRALLCLCGCRQICTPRRAYKCST